MRTINKLFLATLGLLATSYSAHAQVGIGTITPRTMLDINGTVSMAETTATVAGNAATIPLGYSLVRLTGTATAAVALTAASSPAPVAGQHLVIYNGLSSSSATFAGQTIVAGQALAMLYSDGGWRPVVTSAVAAAGTNWGLAGNAGTTAGTNFLGTTDNVDLFLKRGGVVAAQLRNEFASSNRLGGVTSFGVGALMSNTDSLSMAVGFKAGQRNTSGHANLFVGHESGFSNTTGGNNQFIGFQSGYSNTTGGNNYFSGTGSGFYNTTGSNNQFSGNNSGYNNTTGINNFFIGTSSGFYNTTGYNNHFIGYQSGIRNTTGYTNLFIGCVSGFSNTSGSNNQFIGYQSGYSNTTGTTNLFTGNSSGTNNTTGNNNQFTGVNSGFTNTTGNNNLFSGYQSGFSNTTGSLNQFSGYNSGYNNTTGSLNQFSGYGSGYNNTVGNNNLFSGYQSGRTNTTGSNNTLLGYSTNVGSVALTNATAIGYLAQVNQSNSLVLGSINGTNGATASTNVGIGTASPSYPLDVQTVGGGRGGNYSYLTSNNAQTGLANSAVNISINAAGRVAATEFDAFSDVRLKNVEGLSNSRADLGLVKQIQITDYQMKDKVQYGNRAFKKVIAQQVESVFPQAINKNTGFIPSIYAAGTLRAGAPGQTLVTVPAAHALKVGDKVRLIGEANGKIETTVLALSGPNAFTVALPQPETKLFVFGPEVADLRTVDYEALAMLNVSATQELARQVEALQAANAGLRASLADKASASTLTELQTALQTLRAEVQRLRAAGTTASLK